VHARFERLALRGSAEDEDEEDEEVFDLVGFVEDIGGRVVG
jgi:hypothetical protein